MKDSALRMGIREQLRELSDPEYREFHMRLLPGITGIMGVRTPVLRGMAKKLVKDGWQEYICQVSQAWEDLGQGESGVYYDEMILWGLCICGGCRDWNTALPYIKAFVPAINNWAVCDNFCSSLKLAGTCKQESWEMIQPYFQSDREYELRFGVVMLLSYFVDEAHVKPALELMDAIHHQGYYVKMAVAWAISIYFIKLPGAVMPYLEHNHLDPWTYQKALQKITESFRVDPDMKARIRAMKRSL